MDLNEQISGPVFSSCAGMLIHSILIEEERKLMLNQNNKILHISSYKKLWVLVFNQ